MAHEDSDDKVHLAGEGLSADRQKRAAVDAANENASLRDRLLRALAEVENTRHRAERSVADAREYAISDFAAELLSVADNLQRAVGSVEDRIDQTPGDAVLLDGVRATQRQLQATLGTSFPNPWQPAKKAMRKSPCGRSRFRTSKTPSQWFRKHHTCPCGEDWWDEWDYLCNDRCPGATPRPCSRT